MPTALILNYPKPIQIMQFMRPIHPQGGSMRIHVESLNGDLSEVFFWRSDLGDPGRWHQGTIAAD